MDAKNSRMPRKTCSECGEKVHVRTKTCSHCGYRFGQGVKNDALGLDETVDTVVLAMELVKKIGADAAIRLIQKISRHL